MYVSLASVHEWVESDVKLFRIHLYANIVTQIIKTIEQNKDKIKLAGNTGFQKSVKKIAQMFGLNNSENVDVLIERIKELSEQLLSDLTYNPETIKTVFGTQSTMATTGTANVNIPSVGSLGVTSNASYSETDQQEFLYVGNSLSHRFLVDGNSSTLFLVLTAFYEEMHLSNIQKKNIVDNLSLSRVKYCKM